MATTYRIRYTIIPPGVGPDDYEPSDLPPAREDLFDFPDGLSEVTVINGKVSRMGPPLGIVYAAVAGRLEPGAHPAILGMELVEDEAAES
ncbi:hypothetical protein [Streptomyces yaizuensis]|uniref:Uncharacterized protein n=1 Tax=Streptomyces yaizuensis TaxID=2989713 RepID=A0ABQ5P218_9ACTN|nr:hypothetical protein [Streptomyces sp. YSPA8]GLF96630.1 hypothetical protein SYYSPA8_20055 [Streptomyces sp. YSPA8]